MAAALVAGAGLAELELLHQVARLPVAGAGLAELELLHQVARLPAAGAARADHRGTTAPEVLEVRRAAGLADRRHRRADAGGAAPGPVASGR